MQIEQALYGERRGGHSLLASSGDDAMSTEIVHRLDLPDTAPPGIEWSPFLRGFPYADRYVLSRTFRDKGASRGGMVFSHAVLAPLDEIAQTSDLTPLLKLLATSDRQRPDATTVQLVSTESRIAQATDLVDAAEALGVKGQLPVVRLNHVGFDDLVVALWAHLFPEIRRGFAFRLSFDPRDLVEMPRPALVCTPRGMAARWCEYPVIRSAEPREPGSLAGAILSGHGKAAPLIEFMREIGVRPATFPALRLVEQAYLLDIGDPTLERRVGAMRLIEMLSSDSEVGKPAKDIRVRRLCALVGDAKPEELLLLRNVQLTAFPSPKRVWAALETWMAENSYPEDHDLEMVSILENATTSDAAVQEWRIAILDGLAIAAGLVRSSFPRAFWRWLQVGPDVAAAVFHHIPPEAGVEERLATSMPRYLDGAAAETLASHALFRGWLRMHGAVLSASHSPSDAVRRQVAVDTDPSFIEGLQAALRHAAPRELLDCALEVEDPRLPQIAGEAVAKVPRLLDDVDITVIKAQAIWREALSIDSEAWRSPPDPKAAFYSVLDRLLDGGEIDTSLIERLSYSPLGDLGSYPRRPELWSRLGAVARHNLRTTTARRWLRRATCFGVPFLPEDDLETSILEDSGLDSTLCSLISYRVDVVVRIVSALGRYEQQRFVRLLRKSTSRSTSIGILAAESIGRLVFERRWTDVAAELVGQYRAGRRDLRPALQACCDVLDFWDRYSLGMLTISDREKWQALRELATELYPGGPNDFELWVRSGGDRSDLSPAGDGRTRWRRAVQAIRKGRSPTAAALLLAMMEDFPNNERIRYLAGNRKFEGGVLDGWSEK